MTLKALAHVMGHTSGQAASKYEGGAALPAALMFRCANSFDVPISTFFDGLVQAGEGAGSPPPSAGLSDSTASRKIIALLRGTPRSQHDRVLRVVREMALDPNVAEND